MTDLLAPYHARNETVGVMKGHETALRMPLGDWERLMAALPGLRICDTTRLVQRLRMVKSTAEIEKLAHICGIGSASSGTRRWPRGRTMSHTLWARPSKAAMPT